jgi:hypothetical protein
MLRGVILPRLGVGGIGFMLNCTCLVGDTNSCQTESSVELSRRFLGVLTQVASADSGQPPSSPPFSVASSGWLLSILRILTARGPELLVSKSLSLLRLAATRCGKRSWDLLPDILSFLGNAELYVYCSGQHVTWKRL